MTSLFPGLREVFVKDPNGNRVGYFDDLQNAVDALAGDKEYRAVFFSLNVCPRVPDGFAANHFYRASSRFKKGDYARRQLLLVDCDPRRGADSSSTDTQKATAYRQVTAIREFLRNLGFPEPVLEDSGNGYHLLYSIDEPNDESTETLIRNFLAGLSAKFSDEESNVDIGNFEANRPCKLYSTWARKGKDPSLWRQSRVLEVPARETELPAKHGRGRETISDVALEPVPRSVLEAGLAELPVPHNTSLGEMDQDAIRKTDWLRKLCETGGVEILNERRRGNTFIFDIVCPRAKSHATPQRLFRTNASGVTDFAVFTPAVAAKIQRTGFIASVISVGRSTPRTWLATGCPASPTIAPTRRSPSTS
jgi:hypothetical protein